MPRLPFVNLLILGNHKQNLLRLVRVWEELVSGYSYKSRFKMSRKTTSSWDYANRIRNAIISAKSAIASVSANPRIA